VAHGLQGARQDDVIEGLVGELVEATFQVALDDVDAFF
jgi:predicted alpha/beta-fold hydrolase